MENNFPKARDAHVQLLYDRRDYLPALESELAEKVQLLVSELIAIRPKTNATAMEHLDYSYKGLRLQTLLGLVNPNGIFRARVPYDVELRDELINSGYFCVNAPDDTNIMQVVTLSK